MFNIDPNAPQAADATQESANVAAAEATETGEEISAE
jgi:hypothetical protein